MRPLNAVVAASLFATASSLIVMTAVTAGPEKVGFPAYQNHVLYGVLDQPDNKEVRELYVNPEALRNLKPGQPLPSGTVLSAPTFKAVLNDKGELVKDANGRLVRGALHRVVVMEKRTGWGAEYPTDLRNGEWEYRRFDPDGSGGATAKTQACFQCHKPQSGQDFVFSLPQLLKAVR